MGSTAFHQWTDYDDRGLLWKVFAATTTTKPATADVTYTYRPSGEPATRQFAGGPSVPFRYTIQQQLERIGDPALTSYPFSARYAYHANGTISETEFRQAGTPATAKRYRYVISAANYDALNRLKGADFSSWSGTAWTSTLAYDLTNLTYDGAGNLTGLRRYRSAATLVDQLTYSYPGTSNRLSSVTDAIAPTSETWDAETGSFTYDPKGNLLTTPAPYALMAATYDPWNRLRSVTKGGVVTTYRATASGHRLAQQSGSGNTEVTLSEGATVLGSVTVNAAGTPTVWHFNLLAGAQAVGRQPHTGSRRYYHTDLLGSVRAVVTGTTVVESTDYDPWGVVLAGRTLSSGTKEGFTGKARDLTTGLDDFGARVYLSALGRWGGADPAAGVLPEWSPYTYGLNNPLALVDTDGRCSAPPTMRPGYVGICIGYFISKRWIRPGGVGDNRGPVGDDPRLRSRVEVQILVEQASGNVQKAAERTIRSSVLLQGLGMKGEATHDVSTPSTDAEGNISFSVETTAQNGLSWIPFAPQEPINSTIDIVVSRDGTVKVVGTKRDGYPSLEVYAYDARGNVKRVLYQRETAQEDLAPPEEQVTGKRKPKEEEKKP